MSEFLLIFVFDLSERFVGAVFHAQGQPLTPALVAGLVHAPAHDPGLGVAENLDAAPLRPETARVMKGTDQLTDFAAVTERRIAGDSTHVFHSMFFVAFQEGPSVPLRAGLFRAMDLNPLSFVITVAGACQ
jgi:hypothetical protein